MWTQVRITGYVVACFMGIASLASFFGLADYDQATGMMHIKPFNVEYVAGIIAGPISAAVAAVAAFFGWGRK